MLMRIAVCDDDAGDALSLKAFLSSHEVRVYSDAGSVLADTADGRIHYDLYLIDIYIDASMNGIELAKRLRAADEEAVICFVSTSDAFYREAYDLYAVQYLIKPVQEDALRQLVDKVSKNLIRDKEQSLSFKCRGQTGTIPYGKILYIGSREHTIFIYCTDKRVQGCKGKLNELALRICGDVFLRCHQSFIVNMYHVDSLSGNELMISGQRIPISRRYYAEVKKRYQEILFEEVD